VTHLTIANLPSFTFDQLGRAWDALDARAIARHREGRYLASNRAVAMRGHIDREIDRRNCRLVRLSDGSHAVVHFDAPDRNYEGQVVAGSITGTL
jgi:hypothetical protein